MSLNDPNRVEQIRKFSAIYGHFNTLRKTGRPMSLHEASVNEAAAQLCCLMPTLLTRRDDLFPLARQVAKMAGILTSTSSFNAGAISPPKGNREYEHKPATLADDHTARFKAADHQPSYEALQIDPLLKNHTVSARLTGFPAHSDCTSIESVMVFHTLYIHTHTHIRTHKLFNRYFLCLSMITLPFL